jgi:DNA-binding transcriptional ArsR family regulator
MHEPALDGFEKLFLALSDKTRLRILALMVGGEVPVGYLADTLGESQPKISRHLAYLRSVDLVATRRDGKWIYYGLRVPDEAAVARVLDITLRSIADEIGVDPLVKSADTYDVHPSEKDNIYDETYTNDWSPTEIEVHLL